MVRCRSVKMEYSRSRDANAENSGMGKAAGADVRKVRQKGLTMLSTIVLAGEIERTGQGLMFVKMGESSRWTQMGRN